MLIVGIVSRYFSALSERSETGAKHRVLVWELTESGLLSFHNGNIVESRRLNIPRTRISYRKMHGGCYRRGQFGYRKLLYVKVVF
ncbi:hypothetical protein AIR33_20770 [Salmonella enterica]|nr:hypothetical protein [Salmonella enterica]EEJ9028858.1 hypothetical protein [Salmonella enterica subsp. enterica]